jgi:hypothetical protein
MRLKIAPLRMVEFFPRAAWCILCGALSISVLGCDNQGKVTYGENGKITEGTGTLKCEKPQKPYASNVDGAVSAAVNTAGKAANGDVSAKLRTEVVKLQDYSQQGLDVDLILFRICEMSINRGFTNEQTIALFNIALAGWVNAAQPPPPQPRPPAAAATEWLRAEVSIPGCGDSGCYKPTQVCGPIPSGKTFTGNARSFVDSFNLAWGEWEKNNPLPDGGRVCRWFIQHSHNVERKVSFEYEVTG